MSDTNFMSYANAQSVLGGFAEAIKGKDDPYTTISYADWLELTDQEKETGKYYITGVPGADGTIQIDLMTKLWENPDPTVSFAAQDVTISDSGYDMYMVVFSYQNIAGSQSSCAISIKNKSAMVMFATPSSIAERGTNSYFRAFTISESTSKCNFLDSYSGYTGSASTVNNSYCIPYQIYGIKTTHTIKLNAIASDVSTSADKCMLSDGETSVEDFVDEIGGNDGITIASVTADGVKSYSALLQELYPLRAYNCKLALESLRLFGITSNNYGAIMYGSSTGCNIYCVQLKNGAYYKYAVSTSGVSVTNEGDGIPSQGTVIRLCR